MPRNQRQRLSSLGTATAGNLKLSVMAGGSTQQTANISYNAGNAAFDSAIEALSNCDDVVVTGGSFPGTSVTIEQRGVNAEDNLALMAVDATGITSSKYVATTETTPGVAGNQSVNYLVSNRTGSSNFSVNCVGSGSVTSGTFSITINGTTKTGVPYNETIRAICQRFADSPGGGLPVLTPNTDVGNQGFNNGGSFSLHGVGAWGEGSNSPSSIDSSGLTGGSYSISDGDVGASYSSGQGYLSGEWAINLGGGDPCDPINFSNGNEAAITAIIEAISGVGEGNVTVTIHRSPGAAHGSGGGVIELNFAYGIDDSSISVFGYSQVGGLFQRFRMSSALVGINESQSLAEYGAPAEGSFTLTLNGEKTDPISFDAPTGVIQARLEALPGVATGDVVVSGGPLPGSVVLVTFQNNLGSQNIPLMVVDDSLIKMKVEVTQVATSCPDAQQTLTGTAVAGTFTLSLGGDGPTGVIASNASAATVQAALEGILGVGNVTCSGGPLGVSPVTVNFIDVYGGMKQPLMTVDGTLLTGGTVTPAIVVPGGCGGAKGFLLLGVG